MATNTSALPAVSVTEEQTAESADVVPSPMCERLPIVYPASVPSQPSLTLSPCTTPSRDLFSPPMEAEDTSAVEVTKLVLPTFVLVHNGFPLVKDHHRKVILL